MTIEQGMNKLAKVLGESATFNITVNVWNERSSGYYEGDNRVEYSVWNADRNQHFSASTVSKAVAKCIDDHREHKNVRKGEKQSADAALEGVAVSDFEAALAEL
jgi:hypothetical protein